MAARIPPCGRGRHEGPGLLQFWEHLLGEGRLSQLFQRLGLDLPHAFLGHTEGRSDFLERLGGIVVIEAVAANDDD